LTRSIFGIEETSDTNGHHLRGRRQELSGLGLRATGASGFLGPCGRARCRHGDGGQPMMNLVGQSMESSYETEL
jgi:hypothetical protein